MLQHYLCPAYELYLMPQDQAEQDVHPEKAQADHCCSLLQLLPPTLGFSSQGHLHSYPLRSQNTQSIFNTQKESKHLQGSKQLTHKHAR